MSRRYDIPGSSDIRTVTVLVHYGGNDICPSQYEVRAKVKQHYLEGFGASHVEVPVARAWK